ncbi:MAG TPA: adenylyl-sulfate kinase [Saprospiraceae bacterium]|nr:adenylyl-sulfate kinase [Saprospiraceae bacterium]
MKSEWVYPQDFPVLRHHQELLLNQKSCVLWMTGLSGSGKTTLAKSLHKMLYDYGYFSAVMDGDNMRSGLCEDLGFSLEDRMENIRRVASVARYLADNGCIVICSFISPTTASRNLAKKIIGSGDFLEVFIDTPLYICEQRDVKGLYQKARAGIKKDFTGMGSPFETPACPWVSITTDNQSIEEATTSLFNNLLTIIS